MKRQINQKILSLVLNDSKFDTKTFGPPSNTTIYYGLLLWHHPLLQNDLENIRKNLGIKVIKYPKVRKVESVIATPINFGLDKHREIKKRAVEILEKYQLWENWKIPIKVFIATNILPIPQDNLPFIIHRPIDAKGLRFDQHHTLSDLINIDQVRMNHYLRLVKYPAIHITEKVKTKNQIKKWIDDNWDSSIQPHLITIPSRKKELADLERLVLGLWLRELRQTLNWDEIEDKITEIEEGDQDFFSTDENWKTPDRSKGPDLIYSAEEALKTLYPF